MQLNSINDHNAGQYLITFPMKTQCQTPASSFFLSHLFSDTSSSDLFILSFFLFLTRLFSPPRSLINSRGLPSDAFHAPSSSHRPGRRRRPGGYWLNGLKLGEKRELSSVKIKTLLLLSRDVDREYWKTALSLLVFRGGEMILPARQGHSSIYKTQSSRWGEKAVLNAVKRHIGSE